MLHRVEIILNRDNLYLFLGFDDRTLFNVGCYIPFVGVIGRCLRKLVLEHLITIPLSAHDEQTISPGYDPERAREETLGNRLSDAEVVVGSPAH